MTTTPLSGPSVSNVPPAGSGSLSAGHRKLFDVSRELSKIAAYPVIPLSNHALDSQCNKIGTGGPRKLR
jgi:hypothetical protein